MTKGQHKKGVAPFITGHGNKGAKRAPRSPGFPDSVLIDDDDRALFGHHSWSLSGNGYIQRHHTTEQGKHTKLRLHREIMGLPDGIVDHINGNKLDNRRCNLRVTDLQGNAQNQSLSAKNTSGHRGVSWRKNEQKWYAYAKIDGAMLSLGFYDELEEAARVAREYREKHYKSFVIR
jgi:hypothetical protein